MADTTVKVEIEVEGVDTAKVIGRSLVDKARKIDRLPNGDAKMALDLETMGRKLIEDARVNDGETRKEKGEKFEETLFATE